MTSPGHIFFWDLDKTYLRTEFESLRGLVKTALEKAVDKQCVPGAPALIKALRHRGNDAHKIFIISGSPRQMRAVLEAKLALDGVTYDRFVLKPNLQNLLRGRFRALRQQIPYKLPVLLESHLDAGGLDQTLFGDDAEADAIIYSLYADLLAGKVPRRELDDVLQVVQAYDDQRDTIWGLLDRIPRCDPVRRILIHLDKRTPTARFARFGPRLVPIYNYFQAALVLYADGLLEAGDVVQVAKDMVVSGEYELAALANSLQDLLWRGRLLRETASRLALEALEGDAEYLRDWDGPPRDEIAWAFATRVRALGDHSAEPPPEPGRIDYVALAEEEIVRMRRKRSRNR